VKNVANKSFLIVQLTRIGDIIQTYIACKRLKAIHPEISLDIVTRKTFSSGLNFLLSEVFDNIYELDFPTMCDGASGHQELFKSMEGFLSEINQSSPYDVALNFTYSPSSNFLLSLIDARHVLGPQRTQSNHIAIKDYWSQFVYSNILECDLSPFNLIDIYCNILGVPTINRLTEDLPNKEHKKSKTIIIHPFASSPRKQWKASKWTEIIFKICGEFKDYTVNIVGTGKEREVAEHIIKDPILQKYSKRLQNLAGKTNIEELKVSLEKASHFIGHDSMVAHLASITKTPTLIVSLGSVRPIETAPYQTGAIILSPRTDCFPCKPDEKCSFFQCHADVSYQATYAVTKRFLKDNEISYEELKKNISPFHLDGLNIDITYLNNIGHIQLKRVNNHPLNMKELFTQFYNISWSFVFLDQELILPYPKLTKKSHAHLLQYLDGLKQLFDLSEFGKKYSLYILEEINSKSPRIEKIKEFSEKIDDIEKLSELVKETYPLLLPLISYFEVVKANLVGENIVELSESSYVVFNDCTTMCTILYELVENTIAEFKIKKDNREIKKSP
jgi:ADP-heptose:LPS heptosyltransferase